MFINHIYICLYTIYKSLNPEATRTCDNDDQGITATDHATFNTHQTPCLHQLGLVLLAVPPIEFTRPTLTVDGAVISASCAVECF